SRQGAARKSRSSRWNHCETVSPGGAPCGVMAGCRQMPKQMSNVASDDYLTAIYRLAHDEGETVIAVRLADRLKVTPPSVAGMLKRLQRDGLVEIDKRKTIS